MEPNKAFKRRRRKAVKTQPHRYDAKRYKLRCSCGGEAFTGLEENKHHCIVCRNCNSFGDWTMIAKGGVTISKGASETQKAPLPIFCTVSCLSCGNSMSAAMSESEYSAGKCILFCNRCEESLTHTRMWS